MSLFGRLSVGRFSGTDTVFFLYWKLDCESQFCSSNSLLCRSAFFQRSLRKFLLKISHHNQFSRLKSLSLSGSLHFPLLHQHLNTTDCHVWASESFFAATLTLISMRPSMNSLGLCRLSHTLTHTRLLTQIIIKPVTPVKTDPDQLLKPCVFVCIISSQTSEGMICLDQKIPVLVMILERTGTHHSLCIRPTNFTSLSVVFACTTVKKPPNKAGKGNTVRSVLFLRCLELRCLSGRAQGIDWNECRAS